MIPWLRKPGGDPLAVSMTGIRLGDRLLVVGSTDIALIAALAVKVGLTGRACLVAHSESERARSAAAVEQEGALIDSVAAPATSLPLDEASFDVAVLRNALAELPDADRPRAAAEVRRVLRPGGRCLVIDGTRRSGLAAMFGGGTGQPTGDPAAWLTAGGFRGVRRLADREGLSFIEGVKPGEPASSRQT